MTGSLFGRKRLGYVLIESRRLDVWQRFATEGLRLHAESASDGTWALRVDKRQRRIVVRPGTAEDVVATGWQMDDSDALDLDLARLRSLGLVPVRLSGPEAALRGIDEGWRCQGPKGTFIELFTEACAQRTDAPLRMRASGLVTSASGLGHMAITSREPKAMERFWAGTFDARLSDRIEDRLSGVTMDFAFLRPNERHHSIAIASTRGLRLDPLRTSIHHLNLQAASFDDVVQGYRQCRALG